MPKIFGTDIRDMDLRIGANFAMVGVGGLMGMRTSTGVLLGTTLNFAILGPLMIKLGEIVQRKPPLPDGTLAAITWRDALTQWGLWWAVIAMVVG